MSAANLERSDMKKQFRELTVEEADGLFFSGVELRFSMALYGEPNPEYAVSLAKGREQMSPSDVASHQVGCHYWVEVE